MPRLPWRPRRERPRATIVSPTDPHARPRSSRLGSTTEDGQRLRAYLYWLALVTLAFGVLEMVFWVMERTPIRGWIAIGLAVLVIVMLIARRAIDRGRAEQAAIGVAIAAFTVIILAGVWSHAEAPLAIAPLLAVVLAVPFVRGAYLLMLMGLGWAVVVLVAAFQQVGPAATAEPGPASALIAIVSTATVAALLLILVWQHSARLNGIVQAVRTRQAEAEDAELRFRSLFDGVPIGLYRTTSDGRILDANKALAEMLAYRDREELLATPAQLLYSDPATRGPIVDRLEREHSQDMEMELQRSA